MTKRPSKCPRCDSRKVVPIEYGLPGPEMMQDAVDGKIKLGGCVVEPDAPDWYCNDSHYEW